MNTRPFLALAAISLVPAAVIAVDSNLLGSFSVSNTFAAGTPARASEVNQNFTDVGNALMALDDRLGEIPAPANVVTVATSGAPFTSIASAVASITDASATNPYIVRIAPGVYDEVQQTDVPSFVRIEGAGAGISVLRINLSGSFSAGAAMRIDDDVVVSGLTVQNTANTGNCIGISAAGVSSSTAIEDVEVLVDGNGGIGHTAVANFDGDLRVRRSRLFATGATSVNSAFTSSDSAGAFSQPLITNSELEGDGPTSGIAAFLVSTAAEIRESRLTGDSRAVQVSVNGTTRIHNSQVRTLGLNAVYEQSGSAAVLSGSVEFIGGNPIGLVSQFKYVHCYKANLDPVVNGLGSSVQ